MILFFIPVHQNEGHAEGQTQPRVPWQPILWSLLLVLNVTVVVKAFEKWPTWIAPYKCRSSHHIPFCLCQRPRLYYITAHYAHRSTNSLRLIVRPLFALRQEEKREREKEGRRRRGEHITKKRPRKKTDGGRTVRHCGLGEHSGHVALYEEQWIKWSKTKKKKKHCIFFNMNQVMCVGITDDCRQTWADHFGCNKCYFKDRQV